jgi:hypothetical protein
MEQSELATMSLAQDEFADNCRSFGHSCCETLPDAEEYRGNPVVYIVTALTSSQTILRDITLSQDLFLNTSRLPFGGYIYHPFNIHSNQVTSLHLENGRFHSQTEAGRANRS